MVNSIFNSPNKNTLWARAFVDGLYQAGLRAVCISPGSRSTPLTIAFAEHPGIDTFLHLDERCAGFFALGLALKTNTPVALVCTSGTAAANYYPAVIEANYSNVPLLVLTSDRPNELQDSGANQTIDQIRMFGTHVRWFVDVASPEPQPQMKLIRYLYTLAARSFCKAKGGRPGPVHLNFSFRKPLEPVFVDGDVPVDWVKEGSNAFPLQIAIETGRPQLSEEQIKMAARLLMDEPNGMIYCGPHPGIGDFPSLIIKLAKALGYPIFADPLSGLRYSAHIDDGIIIGGYESFLANDIPGNGDLPKIILRFGQAPIGNWMGNFLERCGANGVKMVAVWDYDNWADEHFVTNHVFWGAADEFCVRILNCLNSSLNYREPLPASDWLSTANFYEKCAEQAIKEIESHQGDENYFEGFVLKDVFRSLPENANFFLGNSLPVRYLDQFVLPEYKKVQIFANRGASGIDGVTSTALGVSVGSEYPMVLVIGDISFYHDMNGLLAVKQFGLNPIIVLINNNGGGIFHRLPVSNFDPPFSSHFLTPHGLDFENAAVMYGIDYYLASNQDNFVSVFQDCLKQKRPCLIEIKTDSYLSEKFRIEIRKRTGLLCKSAASMSRE